MAVLALDLASKTGWAVFDNGMDRPFFGTARLRRPNGTNGEAGENLRRLIADQHALRPLTDIVFEAQHIAGKVDPQTTYLLIGMGFMCEWIAKRIGARVFACDIGTWRKHFLGKGGFRQRCTEDGQPAGPTARQQAKMKAMDACAEYGWYPDDDNAADACGVLDYYLSLPAIAKMYPRPWHDQVLTSVRR